ncbi:hypothetical protein [Streptomyces spirodelae]|uniref:Uncharacterized protein n=1 Tax=Streptomyces spirodelae TaxID=2812904 RepID=A0ABS3WVH6_9ACTN|nr:hypothetical protein [Streptomyces spirodelae]MBO8187111.1 hypothetical protein [Streptomyces spirodelae]
MRNRTLVTAATLTALAADSEDIGTVADAGAVWVLRGTSSGLTTSKVASFNGSDFGFTRNTGLNFGEVFDH